MTTNPTSSFPKFVAPLAILRLVKSLSFGSLEMQFLELTYRLNWPDGFVELVFVGLRSSKRGVESH